MGTTSPMTLPNTVLGVPIASRVPASSVWMFTCTVTFELLSRPTRDRLAFACRLAHNAPGAVLHEARSDIGGFKKFLLRGNVVDLAVGVVISAAFAAVVQSFVNVS